MSDPTPTPEATPDAGQAPPVETFSREYVQDLRNEAARYRNEKNTAVEAAKVTVAQEWEAKLDAASGEHSRLETDLGDAWIELQKLHSAIAAGVPSDKLLAFVPLLKGSTADELNSAAESAKALFGGFKTNDPAFDPTQGSGGGQPHALNGDGLLNAVKSIVGAK
jgi:hypothetical protein